MLSDLSFRRKKHELATELTELYWIVTGFKPPGHYADAFEAIGERLMGIS